MTDQRKRFKHKALDQWYRVGQSADENSALLDGFDSGWQARESEVEELRKALHDALDLVFEHHEIGFIRRAYEQGCGSCERCKNGRLENLQRLLSSSEAGDKK